jgi:hypothetical protein
MRKTPEGLTEQQGYSNSALRQWQLRRECPNPTIIARIPPSESARLHLTGARKTE